eukprot:CAMPEP_0196730100 /NCGR_PEP_ID=MMETSP1091-20130531/10246_1 /TAXON_ID=302021 /ORGANISM="Rhodomonas sp., Strain CCMP768" /LENGTH=155 /DNA_ID=CAMNT_0042073047 /DNA_START=24 /DNA_END=491 /DNA_ORIENTATION=+
MADQVPLIRGAVDNQGVTSLQKFIRLSEESRRRNEQRIKAWKAARGSDERAELERAMKAEVDKIRRLRDVFSEACRRRKNKEKEQKAQAKRNQKKMQQMPSTSRDEAKAFAKKDVLEQHPYSFLQQSGQDPQGKECSRASAFGKSVLSWLLLGNR